MTGNRRFAAGTALSIAAVAMLPAPAPAAAAKSVTLRGTAYEFNKVEVRLAGAQVRVAEDPRLGATVRADGSYALKVPDGRKVTPYINAAGHHTIYLQTFATDGQDLENVNFQVPSDAVYGALAALMKVPLAADGNPAQCAIVSTFSTRNVRDVPFEEFTAYGAHGVAGATATATPSLPAPTYFNEDVIPDAAQPKSSEDGGVIWPVVPTGTYTIRAHHPSARFASFTATCAPGRIVNANPPWGLHQLGKANPTRLTARFSRGRLTTIRATGLPKGSKVTLEAPGRIKRVLVQPSERATMTFDLAFLRYSGARPLTLRAVAPLHDGVVVRVAARTHRATRRCVPLGETRPRASCR